MILDEPSAGLDAEAEHEIHRALRRTAPDGPASSSRTGWARSATPTGSSCSRPGGWWSRGPQLPDGGSRCPYARLFPYRRRIPVASGRARTVRRSSGSPAERLLTTVPLQ